MARARTVVVLADTLLRLEILATTIVSPAAATPPGSGMSNPEAVRRSTTKFLSAPSQTRYMYERYAIRALHPS